MHELSIAQHLLDLVREHVPSGDHRRVRAVRLRVGPFAGVMPDSLRFCFDLLAREAGLAGAVLVVESAAARARCAACGAERTLEPDGTDRWAERWLPPPDPVCAACGAARVEVAGGQELQLVSIELAEAGAAPGSEAAGVPGRGETLSS